MFAVAICLGMAPAALYTAAPVLTAARVCMRELWVLSAASACVCMVLYTAPRVPPMPIEMPDCSLRCTVRTTWSSRAS